MAFARLALGFLSVLLLPWNQGLKAAEFMAKANVQGDATFSFVLDDIQWTDRVTQSMVAEKRYRVLEHSDWFELEDPAYFSQTPTTVSGGGTYDDGAFAQCAWRYQHKPGTGGINAGLVVHRGQSASCGVFIAWPMVQIEDPDCDGQFAMFGNLGVGGWVPQDVTFDVPTGWEPWAFTKSHTTNFVAPDGVYYSLSQTVTVQFVPDDRPSLSIVAVETPTKTEGLHSFVATDLITLKASLQPPKSGVTVKWTVQGLEAAAKVGGFPKDEPTTTDATGRATFSFKPSDNDLFVNHRHTVWTPGSTNANAPIGFEVVAVVDSESPPQQARLSEAGLGKLMQDEIDTLRQEFFDYRGVVPDRSEFTASVGGHYNRGNYNVQRNVQLKEYYDKIAAAYRGSIITIDGQPVAIPPDAPVTLGRGGGFRCPRRNVAAGSKYPVTSFHTKGRALDLVPGLCQVWVNGKRRPLTQAELHSQLYPALLNAARAVVQGKGSAITEHGAQEVPPGCCGCMVQDKQGNWIKVKDKNGNWIDGVFCEDHVHVQWY